MTKMQMIEAGRFYVPEMDSWFITYIVSPEDLEKYEKERGGSQ